MKTTRGLWWPALSLALVACGSTSASGGGGSAGESAAGSTQQAGAAAAGASSSAGAQAAGASSGGAQAGTAPGSGGEQGGKSSGAGSGGSAGEQANDLPALPADTKLKTLDQAQRAVLCDWYASKLGGYGHVTECLTGSVKVYDDQAQCIAVGLMYGCPLVTVAQLAECTLGQVPSGGCDRPDEHCHWLDCM